MQRSALQSRSRHTAAVRRHYCCSAPDPQRFSRSHLRVQAGERPEMLISTYGYRSQGHRLQQSLATHCSSGIAVLNRCTILSPVDCIARTATRTNCCARAASMNQHIVQRCAVLRYVMHAPKRYGKSAERRAVGCRGTGAGGSPCPYRCHCAVAGGARSAAALLLEPDAAASACWWSGRSRSSVMRPAMKLRRCMSHDSHVRVQRCLLKIDWITSPDGPWDSAGLSPSRTREGSDPPLHSTLTDYGKDGLAQAHQCAAASTLVTGAAAETTSRGRRARWCAWNEATAFPAAARSTTRWCYSCR
jgi:hypothetical protein